MSSLLDAFKKSGSKEWKSFPTSNSSIYYYLEDGEGKDFLTKTKEIEDAGIDTSRKDCIPVLCFQLLSGVLSNAPNGYNTEIQAVTKAPELLFMVGTQEAYRLEEKIMRGNSFNIAFFFTRQHAKETDAENRPYCRSVYKFRCCGGEILRYEEPPIEGGNSGCVMISLTVLAYTRYDKGEGSNILKVHVHKESLKLIDGAAEI